MSLFPVILRSAMRIAKLVNSSVASVGYQIFMSVAKLIPENSSQTVVKKAFSLRFCQEPNHLLICLQIYHLHYFQLQLERLTVSWSRAYTWVEWWTRLTKEIMQGIQFN